MPSSLSIEMRSRVGDERDAQARASMGFADVLEHDLIPVVEAKNPVLADRDNRALAGLSMGAGLALATGLTAPDRFAWIGAFSGGSTHRLADNPRLPACVP